MSSANLPIYKDYRKYKPYLRKYFNHRCVYCEIREPEFGGMRNFCVEHYRSKSKFPQLKTAIENLLYACSYCNSFKGNYWPNLIQVLLNEIILNPRTDDINHHIETSKPEWYGKTYRGKWNISRLQLSSIRMINIRKDYIAKAFDECCIFKWLKFFVIAVEEEETIVLLSADDILICLTK